MQILTLPFTVWGPWAIIFLSPGFCVPLCKVEVAVPALFISQGHLGFRCSYGCGLGKLESAIYTIVRMLWVQRPHSRSPDNAKCE